MHANAFDAKPLPEVEHDARKVFAVVGHGQKLRMAHADGIHGTWNCPKDLAKSFFRCVTGKFEVDDRHSCGHPRAGQAEDPLDGAAEFFERLIVEA